MARRFTAIAAGIMLFGDGTALAAPFNSFDPRSMAMGGAGVAAVHPATAPLFNPAGLTTAAKKKSTSAVELPILGARIYDPEDLLTGLEDFQDADLIGRLSTANASDAAVYANQLLTDSTTGLPAVDNKPVVAEVGTAMVISIPRRRYGMAFLLNGWLDVAGKAEVTDRDLQLLTAIRDDCLANNAACNAEITGFRSDSKLLLRAISLSEFGVSFSREFLVRGLAGPVTFGVTPKYVRAVTVDYEANLDEANTADLLDDTYAYEQTNFNFDVGAAQSFRNSWRAGLVVKNVIPQEYKFKQYGIDSGTVTFNPQARAGVSYQTKSYTWVLDVDLTENNAVSEYEDKTRYVALGGEMNALNWIQLRFGYRLDTVTSARNVVSAGVGLSPSNMHFDLAVAGNSNELGVAAQFGMRF